MATTLVTFLQERIQCNSDFLAVGRGRGQCSHWRQLCSDCWHRSQYPLTLRAQFWPGWRLAGCWLVVCRVHTVPATGQSQHSPEWHVRHDNQPKCGLTPLAGGGTNGLGQTRGGSLSSVSWPSGLYCSQGSANSLDCHQRNVFILSHRYYLIITPGLACFG